MRFVGCGKAFRSLLRLSIIMTFATDCDALSRGVPEASGVIYMFEKDGGGSFVMGNPIGGIWFVCNSDVAAVRVGSGDGTPDGADATLAPSPGSSAKSFKENPAAREDARSGRFAMLFSKPSVVLDDVVVYEESDSEPESVSESGGWYGVYLEWFIPTFYV